MAPKSKHSAPGPFAGYAFQFERALLRLADNEAGGIVGIETCDDVVSRSPSGTIYEQDKHSIQPTGTPFGDTSNALWNTLMIWAESAANGSANPAISEFHLVTNRPVGAGLARTISEAKGIKAATTVFNTLKETAQSAPLAIQLLSERVFRVNEQLLLQLIQKISLYDQDSLSIGSALDDQLADKLRFPTWARNSSRQICNSLLGWIQRVCMDSWRRQEPAWIEQADFNDEYHTILESLRRQQWREKSENLIPVSKEEIAEKRAYAFVRQLQLIAIEESQITPAITDFIRYSSEMSRLLRQGAITTSHIEDFRNELVRRWRAIRDRIERLHASDSEENRGFRIYSTTTNDYLAPLGGIDTQHQYFTSGAYHRLAHEIEVGWHPRFEAMLETLLQETA
ncbi:conserved hypothetical protein [Haloferula helveola]|uniref:ABC-three component systems C-terminal domain-containing protein n=1 Tax=Haloferula helveola TaxID=490095 RepID=A0ABN6H7G3_9BACT|nr:conserved hypothetical protein [Haloferula helveola]